MSNELTSIAKQRWSNQMRIKEDRREKILVFELGIDAGVP